MTRQTLLDLAARVEGLAGPDREVDEAIQCTIHGATAEMQRHGHNAYHKNGRWISIGKILSYTASIDAAMTLVPEGFYWDVAKGVRRANKGPYWASCYNDAMLAEMIDSDPVIPGNTPALALTAASLRARAAMMEE